MNEEFQALYLRMCRPITFAELQAILEQLKIIGDFNNDLLAAMEEELGRKRWGCLCKLIWAIPEPTPKLFCGFLCKLLDQHRHIEIMEAVADAMFSLKDDAAAPSLTRALTHYLEGDADFHFNRKIIYALANIGSTEAIAGIEWAINSPEQIIRSTAQRELDRLSGK